MRRKGQLLYFLESKTHSFSSFKRCSKIGMRSEFERNLNSVTKMIKEKTKEKKTEKRDKVRTKILLLLIDFMTLMFTD